jgi:dipeptidyl aminopeptidase/acylaminoacyl peptidase|tara:strand:- start:2305 stop:4809 length:2505 start_codon:yes stop_codon:yes gene_type:complete
MQEHRKDIRQLPAKISIVTALLFAGTTAAYAEPERMPTTTEPAHSRSSTPSPNRDMELAYEQAAKVLDANLAQAIRNSEVRPHWIEDGAAFWYQREGDAGTEWVVVDVETGTRSNAFDAERLKYASIAVGASPTSPLSVTALDTRRGKGSVTLAADGGQLVCSVPQYTCEVRVPLGTSDVLWSPDGERGVFVRDNNLWLRERGADRDIQLTSDGVEHYGYGMETGNSMHAIIDMQNPKPHKPANLTWSPEANWLVGIRFDERKVESYPFIQWNPTDGGFRPKLWTIKRALLGDPHQSEIEGYAIEVATRRKVSFRGADGMTIAMRDGSPYNAAAIDFSPDGRTAYGLVRELGDRKLGLIATDLPSGQTRTLISETGPTFVSLNAYGMESPNVRVLSSTGEILWFSERDGWARIYLYSAKGALTRALTSPGMAVRHIVYVDEANRRLFYTSGGPEDGGDPYLTKLYSVSLDGGQPVLLTPEESYHQIAMSQFGANKDPNGTAISPDGRWFVDTYSTVETPPVSVLRRTSDGKIATILERSDVSRVTASGWRPPVRVQLIAADGQTPIWASVYFPADMIEGVKYPVISAYYGGSFVTNAPANYASAVTFPNPVSRASLAQLGFIVVTIDGRGTPGRSKLFHDESYGANFGKPGTADQVAGIRQLARQYGNFDLDRVGIYGHSFGGYSAALAMLTYPDFFKVGVASAGPYALQGEFSTEHWFGPADYGEGRTTRPDPSAVPSPYDSLDVHRLAANLEGDLLLAYGDLDENAPPGLTMQFIKALTDANKPYDLLYMPDATHGYFRTNAYFTQRMWDYFVVNLAGEKRARDFQLVLGTR